MTTARPKPEKEPPAAPRPAPDYVFIERPRCPACGGADVQTERSEKQGDGTIRRRSHCRQCRHPFYVIVE
jgi:hypothetical protein